MFTSSFIELVDIEYSIAHLLQAAQKTSVDSFVKALLIVG